MPLERGRYQRPTIHADLLPPATRAKRSSGPSRAELRREPVQLQRKRPAVVPALSVSI